MSIELIVVTPEGQAYEGSIQQVVLPGSEGDFGVLEQHERYLAPLRSGKMEIIGAFLHDPEIVFLDEPTIGLDLVSSETIRSFRELCEGKWDHLPEGAFMYVGGIDEAVEAAKAMGVEV